MKKQSNHGAGRMACGVSLFAMILCGANAALAQTGDNQAGSAPAGNQPSASGDDSSAKASISDIVVTGTRLVRDGYSQPTPVTVAAVSDLEKATPTNLSDALNKLPQFSNSISPSANPNLQGNSGEHGNLLNLRGVGPTRVLILLDGMRVPPTTYRGAVDSNTIPQLLIQRVDVVTAGASAAYGSDAVSGVVNYVLDTKFVGLKGVAQKGVSTRGDLGNYRLGLAGGIAFAGDRGHLVFSAERYENDGIDRGERIYGNDAYAAVGSVPGSPVAAGRAANPFIYMGNLRSNVNDFEGQVRAGTSTPPALLNQKFTTGGRLRPVANGTPTGTAGTYVGGDGYFLGGDNTLIAPLTTTQGYGNLSYELTDDLTAHVQGSYSRSTTRYNTQSQSVLGFTIYSGNAFLDPSVQALMGPNDNFVLFRQFPDQGPIPTREQTDAYMLNAGLDWKIGGWTVAADFTHGTSITNFAQRQVEIPKMAAALDAVRAPDGTITCRVALTNPGLYPGCTPLNPFGPGTPSTAMLDYTLGVSRYRARNSTDDATLTVQGDLFTLPAGPVAVALGVEYREQALDLTSNSDPAIPLDMTGIRGVPSNRRTRFNNTNVGLTTGRVNVKEAFGEIAIPLFKDKPFARELSINGAGRITDYSTSGSVKTWKLGAVWKPVDDVMFRVTKSRDIRAPSLYELFAGTQTAAVNFTDPHTRASGSIRQLSGGNANLKPEIGNTFSAGIVLQPKFLPGFSASIDYYSLKIENAIATQGLNDVVNECENTNGTSPTCALISRPLPFSDTSAANFIQTVSLITQNIAFLKTSGIDVDLSYRTPLGNGDLTVRAYLNYLHRYVTQTNSIAPAIDYAGHGVNSQTAYAYPKIKSTISLNYSTGGLTVYAQESIIGKVTVGNLVGDPSQVYAEPAVKPVFYTDATISYKLNNVAGSPEVFLTTTNLFDRKPPLVASASAPGLLYPTLFTLYDMAGRTFTGGVRFRF